MNFEDEMTSLLGSADSQLAMMMLGGDSLNEVIVTWIRTLHIDDYTTEMDFGRDVGGHPIVLYIGIPTVLTADQARQAQESDAIILVMGQI